MVDWKVCKPTLDEGKKKLTYINEHGPTPIAFTFKKQFSIKDLEKYLDKNRWVCLNSNSNSSNINYSWN